VHLHPRIGDLVYLELELENADHHSEQSGTSTKQRRVVPIFAYVKYSIKDAVTENTIVNKEICEYRMLLILLSSAENVCAIYKTWIPSEWMYSRVSQTDKTVMYIGINVQFKTHMNVWDTNNKNIKWHKKLK